MPIVRKTLLKPGYYHAPKGNVYASPQRISSWVQKFQKMKKEGIRIPVPWGHQPEALPSDGSNLARAQFAISKYNAGFLVDLKQKEDGSLVGVLDIPSVEVDKNGDLVYEVELPNGAKTKGKIGEVSIAIKDWVDGKGNVWKDSIVHVALTPLPVWHNQQGFRQVFSKASDMICLSLAFPSSSAGSCDFGVECEDDLIRQLRMRIGRVPSRAELVRLISYDLNNIQKQVFRVGSMDVVKRLLASIRAAMRMRGLPNV